VPRILRCSPARSTFPRHSRATGGRRPRVDGRPVTPVGWAYFFQTWHSPTPIPPQCGPVLTTTGRLFVVETTDQTAQPDPAPSRRVGREEHTLSVMVEMYCRAHHAGSPTHPCVRGKASSGPGRSLCQECAPLLEYALLRIQQCRFGDDKPTCAQCPVHCFRPRMREQVREVMRYSGPRMTLRHPYLAVRHVVDSKRPAGRPRDGGDSA
jgi:hypothetical protein